VGDLSCASPHLVVTALHPPSCIQARKFVPSLIGGLFRSFSQCVALTDLPLARDWQCPHFIPDSETSPAPNVRNFKVTEPQWDRAVQAAPKTVATLGRLSPPTLKLDR